MLPPHFLRRFFCAMNIFVSIKPAPASEPHPTLADLIEAAIEQAGFTPFIAVQELQKRGLTPGFMKYIRQQIEQADQMIVLYHPDLRGGLIELGIAYVLGIPIWLAHPTGQKVSTTALECSTKIITYHNQQILLTHLQLELTPQTIPKESV